MSRLIYTLFALILVVVSTAFTAVDHPTIPVNDIGERWSADSLSLSHRNAEAVKALAINRDTLRAESLWRDIIMQNSGYAPALYNLSRIKHIDGAEAIEFAARAYHADTTNKWYCDNYASLLFNSHDFDRALPMFQRLLALDKHQPSTYYFLAYIYTIKRQPHVAIATLDSAEVRIGRNDVLARFKQQLLVDTGQYDRAIETGKRLVADSPYDIDARMELANTYDLVEQDSLARVTYEEAYQLDTTRIASIVELLDYHMRQNNVSERFRFEEKIFNHSDISLDIKLDRLKDIISDTEFYRDNFFRVGGLITTMAKNYPTERKVMHIYATHLCNAEMYEEALDFLRQHIDDCSATVEDYEFMVALDITLERYDLLKDDLKHGVELFKTSTYMWSMYSALEQMEGNTNAAIAILRKALKYAQTTEDRSLYLGRLGDYYHELGKDSKAFKLYEQALDNNPQNAEVLNNYAYFLSLRDKDLYKALAMSQLAITIEENNYNYIDTYAWVLHRLGRNEEAKKYMRQALTLSGQREASLLAHYGDILWALGEKFMADTYWQKAVENGYDAELMVKHIAELMIEDIDL